MPIWPRPARLVDEAADRRGRPRRPPGVLLGRRHARGAAGGRRAPRRSDHDLGRSRPPPASASTWWPGASRSGRAAGRQSWPTPAAWWVRTAPRSPSTARSTCSTSALAGVEFRESDTVAPGDESVVAPLAVDVGGVAAGGPRTHPLLRRPLPRALPHADAGGGDGGDGAGRLHRGHRSRPLGAPPAGPGRRGPGLRHRCRPGRRAPARHAPLPRALDGGRPVGHGPRRADRSDTRRRRRRPGPRLPRRGALPPAGAGESATRGLRWICMGTNGAPRTNGLRLEAEPGPARTRRTCPTTTRGRWPRTKSASSSTTTSRCTTRSTAPAPGCWSSCTAS